MGQLSDAIREHLELKRRHGATDDEISRQEAEALGPVRREPEPTVSPAPTEEPDPLHLGDRTELMSSPRDLAEPIDAEPAAELEPLESEVHDLELDEGSGLEDDLDVHPETEHYDFPFEPEGSDDPAEVFPEPDPTVPDDRVSAEGPPPAGPRPVLADEPVVHDEPLDEGELELPGPAAESVPLEAEPSPSREADDPLPPGDPEPLDDEAAFEDPLPPGEPTSLEDEAAFEDPAAPEPAILEEEPLLDSEPASADPPGLIEDEEVLLDSEPAGALESPALLEDDELPLDEYADEPPAAAVPPALEDEPESELDLEEDIAASLAYEDTADFAPPPPPQREVEERGDPNGLDFDA